MPREPFRLKGGTRFRVTGVLHPCPDRRKQRGVSLSSRVVARKIFVAVSPTSRFLCCRSSAPQATPPGTAEAARVPQAFGVAVTQP